MMTPEQEKAVDELIEFIDNNYLDRHASEYAHDRKLVQLLLKCRTAFDVEELAPERTFHD